MSVFLERATVSARQGLSLTRYLRNIDWVLLAATGGLVAMGLAMVHSATHADPTLSSPSAYVTSQAQGLVMGVLLLVAISVFDFARLARWRTALYAVTIVLLVATLLIGDERMGARRWLPLVVFDLQTSELAKVLLSVAFAGMLAEGVELRSRFRFVVKAVGFMLLPSALIFVQPDLGTALVLGAMTVAMLVVWGIRWTHFAALAGVFTGAVAIVVRVLPTVFGIQVLKPYQIERLLVFLNPERDTSGAAYQLSQSKIAVASGMFTGKGYQEGTQTLLNFLPAHHTDFIFAVIGEELGFVGAMLLLGLYLVVLWRALRIAALSKSLFGSLIAAGIVGALLFQVFVNVGMTIGLMPITGVPLPFVSFGSSSLVVFLMAVGLLQSIHIHSRTAVYRARSKGEPHAQMAD